MTTNANECHHQEILSKFHNHTAKDLKQLRSNSVLMNLLRLFGQARITLIEDLQVINSGCTNSNESYILTLCSKSHVSGFRL